MHGYNLVAIYPTLEEARRVSDRLLAEGFSAADVRLTDPAERSSGAYVEREPHHERGFFDWLFASDVPDYDRERYTTYLNENRAAVSVRAADDHWRDRAIAIMEEFNPIDIEDDGHAIAHEHAAVAPAAGTTAIPVAGAAARTDRGATAGADLGATTRAGMNTGARTDAGREREVVIPVVKEELGVGKRATEQRYRIKTYVIEHPIEKQATVRDERVEIEHRPISRTGDLRMPEEREIEVVERREEPFAEKRVTADEEIVVRKEVVERPETVRGTVRETKVDVEKEPVGTAAGAVRGTAAGAVRGTAAERAGSTPPPTPKRTDR
ncbi:MAG: YsnF/AvaK domain-containing protein [Alphaproteobacteria bacterium]